MVAVQDWYLLEACNATTQQRGFHRHFWLFVGERQWQPSLITDGRSAATPRALFMFIQEEEGSRPSTVLYLYCTG